MNPVQSRRLCGLALVTFVTAFAGHSTTALAQCSVTCTQAGGALTAAEKKACIKAAKKKCKEDASCQGSSVKWEAQRAGGGGTSGTVNCPRPKPRQDSSDTADDIEHDPLGLIDDAGPIGSGGG
ncbi:MAG TPA: hypothetical protein PKC49_09585, partial [Phycisphaerae bacterium]|nr:hypothetical protein [Phycisphaerae bacterium]